jgi:hypothetical protein
MGIDARTSADNFPYPLKSESGISTLAIHDLVEMALKQLSDDEPTGARLLADDAFACLAAGISPERVTSLARRSRRVFYDHFDNKEEYHLGRDAVLGHVHIGIDRPGHRRRDQQAAGVSNFVNHGMQSP